MLAITVDGEPIRLETTVYYAVNKPKGYVSTNFDPSGRPRVVDLLPEIPERVYTVGRLDEDSTGLLILTNDGELANKLAHPRYGVEKVYRALVAGLPGPEMLAKLTEGIWLSDGKVRAKRARIVGRQGQATQLELVLAEGKKREIRRMLSKLGHKVMSLTRIAMGPVTLKGLPTGNCRPLSRHEVDLLRKVAAGIAIATPRSSKAIDRIGREASHTSRLEATAQGPAPAIPNRKKARRSMGPGPRRFRDHGGPAGAKDPVIRKDGTHRASEHGPRVRITSGPRKKPDDGTAGAPPAQGADRSGPRARLRLPRSHSGRAGSSDSSRNRRQVAGQGTRGRSIRKRPPARKPPTSPAAAKTRARRAEPSRTKSTLGTADDSVLGLSTMNPVAPAPASHRLAVVVENVPIARDTYRLRLADPLLASLIKPGQFVMIRPGPEGSTDPLLGRPLALYDVVRDSRASPPRSTWSTWWSGGEPQL